MKNKIEKLLNEEYAKLSEEEILQSHFLNYICILISGYLETEFNNKLKDYKSKEHFKIHECKDKLSGEKLQNATWCKIKPILAIIEDEFPQKLKNSINNFDLIIQSIQNIVVRRNNISHGKDITGLTIEILTQDFKNIQNFLEKLNTIFDQLN
jgi:hypothetical protein